MERASQYQKSRMNSDLAIQQYEKTKRAINLARHNMQQYQKQCCTNIFDVPGGGIVKETDGDIQFTLIDINLNQPPKLIEQYFSHYDQVDHTAFVNCKINSKFIDKQGVRFLGFTFRMCAIGNLFFKERFNNVYINLQALVICSDAFGNHGLRILMLNYIPQLFLVRFDNTNLTKDCVKILNKNYLPLCTQGLSVCFKNHKHFQYDQLLKQCKTIQAKRYRFIEGDFHQKYQSFMYLNNLIKIKQPQKTNNKIYFKSQGRHIDIINNKNMLLSPKNKPLIRDIII